MADTPITPTVGAITLAGVASSLANANAIWARGGDGYGQVIAWTGLVNPKTGAIFPNAGDPNPPGGYKSISMQAVGTFGAGGSVQLEGSDDGTNWSKLSPAALTSAGVASPAAGERTRYYRPNVTAGDGSTLLNCYLFLTFGP